jgi:lipoprotein NlpD
MQFNRKFGLFFWLTVIVVTGCVGEPIVPVSDLTTPKSRYASRAVRVGDTLYMIAWETGLDHRQLAEWNKLTAPYQLTAGTRIRLTAPDRSKSSGSEGSQTRVTGLATSGEQSTGLVAIDATPNAAGTEVMGSSINRGHRVSKWLWPAEGRILQRFTGKNGNNGVDISGRKGAPVRAAAGGVVVYAGSGLRGYGQLLIIQHNDMYLSAYAHNNKLLVTEGELVTVGQRIAEIGDSDAESPRLHFEIRRNGKPVNPLDYLPSQSS